MAVNRVGHTAPLVEVGKAEPAVENRLRSSRAKRRRLRRGEGDDGGAADRRRRDAAGRDEGERYAEAGSVVNDGDARATRAADAWRRRVKIVPEAEEVAHRAS